MSVVKRNIKRMLQYKLCLLRFKELGFNKIYSYNLGEAAGVSAVQVRKDFSEFGIKGNKKGGYNIDYLITSLNDLFGNQRKNVIIVGMGNIGYAMAQYGSRFIQKNIHIIAGFDIDPSKQKRSFGIPVYPMSEIPFIVEKNMVSTAIIAVPFQTAQEVCNVLVECGIRGILNFAPVILKVPDHIVMNDINISNELESIMYIIGD